MMDKCEICDSELMEVERIPLTDNVNGGYRDKIIHHCPIKAVPEDFPHYATTRIEGRAPHFRLFAYYPYLVHHYPSDPHPSNPVYIYPGESLIYFRSKTSHSYKLIYILTGEAAYQFPWRDEEKMKNKLQLYSIFS